MVRKLKFVQAGLQNLPVDGNFQVNVKAQGTSLKKLCDLDRKLELQ